jgi:acyl carrier protein
MINLTTRQEKLAFVKKNIEKLKGTTISDFTEDTNLLTLGLDSLNVVELQMEYEEATGHELNPDATITTVRSLVDLMK